MIKFEHTEVVGWEHAIRGMRNPLNSWDKSDSLWTNGFLDDNHVTVQWAGECDEYQVGPNDSDLMKRLCKAGSDHRKFMRMLTVYVDITAPLYWWKEHDQYKVGTTTNSCSTMHKIHDKPIELSDFSIDDFYLGDDSSLDLKDMFINVVADCEYLRKQYLIAGEKAKDKEHFTEAQRKHFGNQAKRYWKGLIQLLPTSYNQKRTVMLNYEVLANIYKSRKGHKLTEWHDFLSWLETLPHSEFITGEVTE